jgi:8-amino-7-oxononanoate synthase
MPGHPFHPVRRWEAEFEAESAALEQRRLRRVLPAGSDAGLHGTAPDGARWIQLASNDYLGLARHPQVLDAARAALEQHGAGATGSPLICGRRPLHAELEQRLAEHKGYPAALLFSSGFAANLGVAAALLGPGDTAFADRLAHASLLDGLRLSGARLRRFRHNDPEHLRALLAAAPAAGRRMIVTESVFSMDGDLAPLEALADLAEAFDAGLWVDEAHATGLYGPSGAGRVAELGLAARVSICMGTLSKALGSAGGFVACSEGLRDRLVQCARSFIYSTALPPPAVGAALGALELLRAHPQWGGETRARAARFRERLRAAGAQPGGGDSAIVPLPAGTAAAALDAAARARAEGVRVVAIRPPTVPEGSARLRCAVSLGHAPEDLDDAAEILARALRGGGTS